jgi:hypothetical protein
VIANSKFTQPVTVRVDTETESGSQAEDEAVRYDLSIRPLVAALREGVTRIAAEMVLVVVGGALWQGRDIAGEGTEHDLEVSALVKAIRAPAGRVRTHHHLTEAARLIEAASTQYWKSLRAPHRVEAILRPLKAGWWHLQTVASRAGAIPLVDLGDARGVDPLP